ncbi:hypothetical protein [Paenibacillus eucommiae]|uniref:Uncharacterized protein n=1 Tax=Paenibacillus eucommiae TaxID=1355755 RepID=A0ABS4J5V3_9BACL|nr:hypothetical protein [Paenibacillus eucommiae]MBP1994651.1 hypothetical protein [Paenibacillus eucommiae]
MRKKFAVRPVTANRTTINGKFFRKISQRAWKGALPGKGLG